MKQAEIAVQAADEMNAQEKMISSLQSELDTAKRAAKSVSELRKFRPRSYNLMDENNLKWKKFFQGSEKLSGRTEKKH